MIIAGVSGWRRLIAPPAVHAGGLGTGAGGRRQLNATGGARCRSMPATADFGGHSCIERSTPSSWSHRPCFVNVTGAFATIGQRLIDHSASNGTIDDFGRVHGIFFRDPDGLEGEGY